MITIENFCEACGKRGKCAEPCEGWYECLERQLKGEE